MLTSIELVEISLVTLPAASHARVTSVRRADPVLSAFLAAARAAARSIERKTR